ncbi:MAG TPA: CPBP family intramembrane glutamic endopeptidase [Gemmatimonadaceae bacterium]|nr:CPBP family intramembrane glutamic endopeptidase [Gemmatimonadaceae bacterium]
MSAVRQYWTLAPTHRYSLTFALPLLVAYELLAAALSDDPRRQGLRNGADVLLKAGFVALAGPHGPTIFMGLVVLGALWLIARDRRRSAPLEGRVFVLMLVESTLLALALGVVVGTLTAQLLGFAGLGTALAAQAGTVERLDLPTRLMLSLGAGLYEELAFRVLLVAALARGAQLALGWSRRSAGVLATILGALLFSAFHYVGPYGDRLELASFTYRAIAGLVFSALYLARGFGITAWTHALYDVWVMVVL